MLYSGEDVGDAAIKTGGHLLIQLALGVVGGPIGFFAGVGFVLGVAGSMLFDKVYDDNIEEVGNWIGKTYEGAQKNVENFVDSVSDTAGKIWDSAGDAVNGFFSGLGSVF